MSRLVGASHGYKECEHSEHQLSTLPLERRSEYTGRLPSSSRVHHLGAARLRRGPLQQEDEVDKVARRACGGAPGKGPSGLREGSRRYTQTRPGRGSRAWTAVATPPISANLGASRLRLGVRSRKRGPCPTTRARATPSRACGAVPRRLRDGPPPIRAPAAHTRLTPSRARPLVPLQDIVSFFEVPAFFQ